jgi:hypothetical protein
LKPDRVCQKLAIKTKLQNKPQVNNGKNNMKVDKATGNTSFAKGLAPRRLHVNNL